MKNPKLLRGLFYISICLLTFAAITYFFWIRPTQQLNAAKGLLSPKEFFELKNGIRVAFAQAVAGAVLLTGLFFTWRNLRVSEGNLRINQEISSKNLAVAEETLRASVHDREAERFSQAVEQLGSEQTETRIRGIHTLERFAKTSEEEHWQIIEILTAYLRRQSPWMKEEMNITPLPLSDDLRAICNFITRRNAEYEKSEQQIDLHGANLQETNFSGAYLAHANFSGSNLEGADFSGAHLKGANLEECVIRDASFAGAEANEANFLSASGDRVNFLEAKLSKTTFGSARLPKADFRSADLSGASLYESNLESASLEYVNLRRAGLQHAKLGDAKLYAANLEGANMYKTDLTHASLREANLDGADLSEASLVSADLSGAHLDQTNLGGAELHFAILNGAKLENSLNLSLPDVFDVFIDETTTLPPEVIEKRSRKS